MAVRVGQPYLHTPPEDYGLYKLSKIRAQIQAMGPTIDEPAVIVIADAAVAAHEAAADPHTQYTTHDPTLRP